MSRFDLFFILVDDCNEVNGVFCERDPAQVKYGVKPAQNYRPDRRVMLRPLVSTRTILGSRRAGDIVFKHVFI